MEGLIAEVATPFRPVSAEPDAGRFPTTQKSRKYFIPGGTDFLNRWQLRYRLLLQGMAIQTVFEHESRDSALRSSVEVIDRVRAYSAVLEAENDRFYTKWEDRSCDLRSTFKCGFQATSLVKRESNGSESGLLKLCAFPRNDLLRLLP